MRSQASRVNLALCTAPNRRVARRLARTLVEEELAACANLVPFVTSIYRWKGKICDDREVLLLIKTSRASRERLSRRIREIHPYDTPEILFLPIASGEENYLQWLLAALAQGGRTKGR